MTKLQKNIKYIINFLTQKTLKLTFKMQNQTFSKGHANITF